MAPDSGSFYSLSWKCAQYNEGYALAHPAISTYEARHKPQSLWGKICPVGDPVDKARYAAAGVDIDAGNRMVDLIKPLVRGTARAGADAEIGGLGGLFDLKAAGYTDPILVAANDGVGTKVKIAIETNRHDTIGIDLVAMSVNDLVVQGDWFRWRS